MFGHKERVLGFGKKESIPNQVELLKRLHTLGGVETEIIEAFKEKMEVLEHGMMIEKTVADTALQATVYRDTIAALSEHGHTITEEQLEAFIENTKE